jgi:hypothetical protein
MTTKGKTTLDILRDARERIADPARWCQRCYRDEAGRCCAKGAVYYDAGVVVMDVTPVEVVVAIDALDDAAFSLYRRYSVIDVNDQIGHAAVMACYDHAIKGLQS